jgi:lipoate-protein ligase B
MTSSRPVPRIDNVIGRRSDVSREQHHGRDAEGSFESTATCQPQLRHKVKRLSSIEPSSLQTTVYIANHQLNMLIRHLRLKGIVPYAKAANLQQDLVTKFLAHKASPTTTSAPTPTIITAQFSPVYTCGRREVGTVSEEQQTFLKDNGNAEFYEALRGGQTTFHGPGQLVAYPIIDLKTHGLSPRNYVCLLEKTLIKTCARYGIKAMTTEHPGVWTTPDDKISALGVHLRRNITSHGIGLNVNTDLKWFSRIVACGLEGKRTTSFENEGVHGQSVDEVADTFVRQLAESLESIDGVQEELII